jgi:hypothetical protein
MKRTLIHSLLIALVLGSTSVAGAARQPEASAAQTPLRAAVSAPVSSIFTAPLAPTGLSIVAIPLDVAESGIVDANTLGLHIEAGGTEGAVKQLLKWDVATQTFLAYSHEYGYGDNFEVKLGDVVLLIMEGGPADVTLEGRKPDPGEVQYTLTASQPGTECALNFISLPFDQAHITDADLLSDAIGGVVQALDWDEGMQMYQAWSNLYGYGDNFAVQPGHAYMVCLDQSTPQLWPGGVQKLLGGSFS